MTCSKIFSDFRAALVPVMVSFFLLSALLACSEDVRTATPRRRSQQTMSSTTTVDASIPIPDSGFPVTIVDAGEATVDAGTIDPSGPGELVKGLAISNIDIFQGVQIRLVEDGTPVSQRNAPIIQNRPALLRVYVQPLDEWSSRSVLARLKLEGSSFGEEELVTTKQISRASSESFLASSINFEIDASYMVADLRWSISLEEEVPGVYAGVSDSSRYPRSDTLSAMQAQSSGESVKITLIPIRYDFDGTGRLPSTTPEQLERYREGMFKLFPTPEIEITVREPLGWDREVQAFGNGWGPLLQAILNLRRSEGAARNEYYYGIFSPKDSFSSYCNRGCIAGLSSLSPDPENDYVRGSIGLGFDGDRSVGTFIHEVGHAHGRRHAPCGLGPNQESDGNYPYSNAQLGVWGYDLISKVLVDPVDNKDVMSYCDPRWISDYQYSALFDRISYVNRLAYVHPPIGHQSWRSILVDIDGTASWGNEVPSTDAIGGQITEVSMLNHSGQLTALESARFFPFSHLPGGIMMIPEPASDVRSVRLPNGFILRRD